MNKKRVLFSLIGSSDPIRNNYDGPMLHIVRHYQPVKVFLFLSAEMVKREKGGNLFCIKAINSISEDIDIELFESDIKDVTDYDVLAEIIPEKMDEFADKNSGCEVLVNISSGTPQMISTMNLHIAISNKDFKPIQVFTPEKKSNTSDLWILGWTQKKLYKII